MADFKVAIWVLCAFGVIQGQTTSDDSLEDRVMMLERQGVEQGKLIASLLERLDNQDAHILTQTHTMETQQRSLDSQNVQLQEQSRTLEQQGVLLQHHARQSEELWSVVRRQSVVIKSQERALQNMIRTLSLKSSSLSHMKGDNSQDAFGNQTTDTQGQDEEGRSDARTTWMGQQLESKRSARSIAGYAHAKRLVMAPEGPVAFHAVIDKGEVPNIGINQNVVFDVVLENLGGGYHNQHGIFIAPANGVYIFSVSVMSFIDAHPEFRADLKKDGVTLARAFGHGDNHRHDQGSVTIVTNLSQGNEVWVSLEGITDDSIFGARYTSFMGYLLYPL